MTISKLATYSNITSKSDDRGGAYITRITPHHMSGVHSGQWCADYFADTDRQASANYCIGVDGDVAANVEEERRAWTSGSYDNDSRAITVELSDGDSSYNYMTDATIDAFVDLCVDLLQRYPSLGGKMVYTGDESGNVTLHRWYQDTDCPSAFLIDRLPVICQRVNERLGATMRAFITVDGRFVVYFDGSKMKVYGFGRADERECLDEILKANGIDAPNLSWTAEQYEHFCEFLER